MQRNNRFALENCVLNAQSNWQSTFELNSNPIKGKEARSWHSTELRNSINEQLETDKNFCLKQFSQF